MGHWDAGGWSWVGGSRGWNWVGGIVPIREVSSFLTKLFGRSLCDLIHNNVTCRDIFRSQLH